MATGRLRLRRNDLDVALSADPGDALRPATDAATAVCDVAIGERDGGSKQGGDDAKITYLFSVKPKASHGVFGDAMLKNVGIRADFGGVHVKKD